MPKEDSRGGAYEILWNDCSGQCVGETLLTMAVRRRERKRDKNGEELFRLHSHCVEDQWSTGPEVKFSVGTE